MKIKKNIQAMYQNNVVKKKVVIIIGRLLLIREEEKKHYVLIKHVNRFIYDHSLHRGKKIFFCRYCLHASITEDVLKFHIKDCSKINGKQTIKMSKKVNMLNSKISKER